MSTLVVALERAAQRRPAPAGGDAAQAGARRLGTVLKLLHA
jgi:hypothetical protein